MHLGMICDYFNYKNKFESWLTSLKMLLKCLLYTSLNYLIWGVLTNFFQWYWHCQVLHLEIPLNLIQFVVFIIGDFFLCLWLVCFLAMLPFSGFCLFVIVLCFQQWSVVWRNFCSQLYCFTALSIFVCKHKSLPLVTLLKI